MASEKKINQVILGFLSHEDMTGYEIKKHIDSSLHFFWSGSYGSIYPALNELENEKLVVRHNVSENGREKLQYTITDAGKMRLKEWLARPAIKDELHYETLLKVFFGGAVGEKETRVHIENFEKKVQRELAYLEVCVEQLKNLCEQEDHKYYLLTAMFGVETYKGYLRWCESAKALLTV